MVDIEYERSLSKVTTPIRYHELDEEFFKMWEKEGKNQISPEEKNKWLEKTKDPCFRACTIGYLGDTLVRHCAQKIYIIDIANKLDDETLSGLPRYLKNRIVWADSNCKIEKIVISMLTPICDDLEAKWEILRKENNIDSSDPNGHEHGYCILKEFLRTLFIALKYNTEADVDLHIISQAIIRIKPQLQSPEAISVLSRIEGVVKCYQITDNIPGLQITIDPTPADLLENLLDDTRMIELSQSRFLLGIPGSFQIAMIKIKQELSDILKDKQKRKYLSTVSKLGNIATRQIGLDMPELEFEYQKMFGPPLISIHNLKPNCLKTSREFHEKQSVVKMITQLANQ